MNENDDENLKKAKQAADMFKLQQKAKDYQDKVNQMNQRVYHGKCQGISADMKGDYSLIDVRIDQSYYETASKGQIEKNILQLFQNLKSAIKADEDALKSEIQDEIANLEKEHYKDGTN